jgi:DNA polymerase I-like protein with 3'-5' exonuclease and polymerase domains
MALVPTHEITSPAQGSQQIYNGMDSLLTYEIFEALEPMAPSAQHTYNFERALQGPVLEMMLRGFRIDPFAREQGIDKTKIELARVDHILDSLVRSIWDKGLNPNSGPQLKDLFYATMGLPEIHKSVKGESKTPMDRDTLEKLEVYFLARPIVKAILARRDLAKQIQVLETQVDRDWRMRASFNIAGTDTGRFSSSKSPERTGTNLQNISEKLRFIFRADPGYKLYGIDLEQAESREVGLICGLLFNDWTYLDATESGDLHTTVCKMVWSGLGWTGDAKADRKIADQPFYREHSYRDIAKKLGHGSSYMGKPYTMSMHARIPVSLCEEFQHKFFSAFPCIPRWHHWVASEIQTTKCLTNVFGHTRDFFDRTNSDKTLRGAVAHMPQSATAQRLNLGMWRLWRHYPQAKLLTQLHDAVYFQVPDTVPEKEVARKALALIEIPMILPNGRHFTIPGECKVGLNWGRVTQAHEWSYREEKCIHCGASKAEGKTQKCVTRNPDGMRKVVFN